MDKNLRFFIRKPGPKQKSYALVCYTLKDRKTRVYESLSEKLKNQLDALNAQFLSGILKSHDIETLLADLIQKQYSKADVREMVLKNSVLTQINQKTFNSFWAAEYETRFLVDEKSARYDILKAIRLIEPLSLQTATKAQLQSQLKKNTGSVAQLRRATDRMNQLLRFLDRDFTLEKPKKARNVVKHLTFTELRKVLPQFSCDVCKDLALALFSTGLRMSEAIGLEESDLSGRQLNITRQLTKDARIADPKRDSKGFVLVLKEGTEALERWLQVPDKDAFRWKFAKELEAACVAAFPETRTKWMNPHALRHSHAIHLLVNGATLKQVALNLRNEQAVCEEYYVGYAHSEGTLDGLRKLMD